MASNSSRSSSSDNCPNQEPSAAQEQSNDVLGAVPGDTVGQEAPSPSKRDSKDAKGRLKVKWTSSESPEPSSASSAILDIVVIQGLYGSGKELAEEGTDGWTHEYLKSFAQSSRLMLFEWEGQSIFAGRETGILVGTLSRCLLECLANAGGEQSIRRSVMFVADDLGSLILKDALVTAAASKDKPWLDILDRTRALVFRGCPHRSGDQREMEDSMAEFVLGARPNSVSGLTRPTLAAILGLAEETIKVNGLFMLSKIHVKCSLISLHHGGRYVAGGPSGVFDEFVGTFGLPFERRVDVSITKNGDQSSSMLQHLEFLRGADTWPDTDEIEWLERGYERTLMCLCSSVTTFKTPPFEQLSLLQNSEVFTEWLESTNSNILNISGGIDMTEVSEQLFYVLDQQATRENGQGPVLYFSFNRHDKTRQTLRDMLSTFLGQIICHNVNRMSLYGQLMFVQFQEEHGWTDRDLLQWFSYFSTIIFIGFAFIVIDGFDECPEAGRDFFMEWLYQRITCDETPYKVAITSGRPVSLTQGLQRWSTIDLADIMASDEFQNTDMQSVYVTELRRLLVRYRPELLNDDAWAQPAAQVSRGDHLIQNIILGHSISIPEWRRKLFMKEISDLMGDKESGDELLMKILDSIFRKLPGEFQVKTMLKWLLHSVRPLSLWEFTSVMYPECLDNPHASPGSENVGNFVQICETRLRGIIEIRDTTVRLREPRLRELLTRPPSAVSPAYLWNDIDAAQVAYDITKFCLEFLARPNVQQELESMVEQGTLDEHTYRPGAWYTNFCSYAAYYWPQHAALIPTTMGLSSLVEEYKQNAMNPTWLKAYWCLENPVTRARQPSESVDALLAELSLPHSDIGTWDSRSILFATQRSAAQGQHEIVETMLHQCERFNTTLVDVLIAAASSGQENLVLRIWNQIKTTNNGSFEDLKWPPCLIYRAAWLGMDRFARALLEAGCSPDPGGPMVQKFSASPLHQAARHGHIATIEALLSHNADTGFATVMDRSILFTAAYSGRPDVFKTLFEKGKVDVTRVDEGKATPLAFSARCGWTTAIKSLLEIGADPHDDKDLTSSDIGWLPLVESSAEGHTESARILLDNNANPNQPGPEGENTALWYAVVNNFPETVRVLLENGADPNHLLIQPPILGEVVREAECDSPAKVDLIDLLVKFGARIDAADGEGKTALMHAIMAGIESVVARMLELGASVDAEDKEQRRPLHLAAVQGSEEIFNLILTKNPNLDCLDRLGRTALTYAVRSANQTRILLEKGADPDLAASNGPAPLFLSASQGLWETVKVLLSHHAQVNLRNSAGLTAVAMAAYYDRQDIVKLLIDAGALLSLKSHRGSSPLHVATPSTARVLLQHRKRLNIDEPNAAQMTPLHCANWSKTPELTKLLIDSGANLNLQDFKGETPLGCAAYLGNYEAAKILLQEEDCDQTISSNYGWSPLHHATVLKEGLEMVRLLVEKGANVNQNGDRNLGSPLQTACTNAKSGKKIIEYLLQQGATANVTDAMGRNPIHISCVGGAQNFHEIYKAGGNHNLRDRDKMRRTMFHWAAQHWEPEILEDLITELGTELVDEADIDGWTPLLWACWPGQLVGADSGPADDDDESKQRQVRVFRILLRHGARPNITGKIGDSVWSFYDVALFNKIEKSCLQLVDDALGSIEAHIEVPSEITEPIKGRIGAVMSKDCYACFYDIRGLLHICSKCNMCLCYKCYWHRDLIHDAVCEGTEWEQTGPDLEEEKVPVESASEGEAVESGGEDEDSDSSQSSALDEDAL